MGLRRASILVQSIFYALAGINHFVNPGFYYPLIPDYLLQVSQIINVFAGIAEVVLGILLIFHKTRKPAAMGIFLMLIAFVPSHIYFIQIGSCVDSGLCVPEWVGWMRLILIHPLLMLWAWKAALFRSPLIGKSSGFSV